MQLEKNHNTCIQFIFCCALLSLEMIIFLSNDMFLPAVHEIATKFTINQATAQQSVTLWFIGSAMIQLMSGPLDERFGHKKTLIAGILNFTLASLMCFYATNYTIFSIGRFFEGASVGLILTAGYSLIHETNSSIKAIKTISIMRAFSIIPAAIGPTIGAIFISFFNWQSMFLWFTLLSFCLAIIFYFYTPPCKQNLSTTINIKQIISSYLRMFKTKKMMGYAISSTFILMLLVFWIVESVKIIIQHNQQSIKTYGIIQCSVALMLSVGSMFAAKISKSANLKLSIASILSINFLCMTLGYALLRIFKIPISFSAILVGITFLCSGTISEILNRLAIESSPESVGMSNSFIIAVRSIGASVACLIGGLVLINMQTFFAISSIYTFISLIIFIQYKKVTLKEIS